MSFDFGQATIDNEIALMIKRVREGFGFSKESASLRRSRPPDRPACSRRTRRNAGTHAHCNLHARTGGQEATRTVGAGRRPRRIHQRAMNKALEILSTPNSAALDPAVDERIRAEFEDLVAGDSTVPPGWQRLDVGGAAEKRERRTTRRRRRVA